MLRLIVCYICDNSVNRQRRKVLSGPSSTTLVLHVAKREDTKLKVNSNKVYVYVYIPILKNLFVYDVLVFSFTSKSCIMKSYKKRF